MVGADLVLISLSMFLAFAVRFDWSINQSHIILSIVYFIFLACAIRILLFLINGLYQWSFQYASISEVINIIKTVTLSSFLILAVSFFTQNIATGRSVLLIDYLFCLFFIVGSRFGPRILVKYRQQQKTNLKRVLIVGAGATGEAIAREMINARNRIYQPIGFIDDNPVKLNAHIHGIKVLGATSLIRNIVEKYKADEVIIAIPSVSGKAMRDIVSKCSDIDIRIRTVPGLHKILTGEVVIKEIRDVRPDDLLGREAVEIDEKDIASFITDKTILITGAGGSIGAEICRQVIKFNPKSLILYDYNENDMYFLSMELKDNHPYIPVKMVIGDIKDVWLLKDTFCKNRPQIVYHSAAHKHVPLMEESPASAVKNNILGTRNIMYASEHYGVKSFVMISTDKAVNPTSIMGASKRIAEMMIQAKAKTARTKFMAVRFGNVIGSHGSVVPIFKQQIEKGGPLTVTHPDIKRFFMTAHESALLVIQASSIGKGGEIFVLDMGEQIKIVDLAKNLVTLSGLKPHEDIEIKFVGLRPGEKMHEETLLDTEHDRATKHNKIYIAQPNDFDLVKLRKDIKVLEKLIDRMEPAGIVEKIKEMVPSYNPSFRVK